MDVNQFVPALARRDAVSDHALQLHELFRSIGRAQLFFEHADQHCEQLGRHFHEYRPASTGESVNLLHLSIGTPLARTVEASDGELVVNYHDMTPPHFFETFDPHLAGLLRTGRQQLKRLAAPASGGWADSRYTETELLEAGYKRTTAIPILIDPSRLQTTPNAGVVDRIRSTKEDGPDVLFVGRLAPNKRIEDLVNVLHVYRRHVGTGGRLFVVGAPASDLYSTALQRHAGELLGNDAVFVGSISTADLAAYYSACDVYLSMSEHEGFGVPYVEAMHYGLPILALGRAATAETVGSSGIVLERRDLLEFALALHEIFTKRSLQRSLAAGAVQQRRRFDHAAVAARVLDFMGIHA